jgi:hypothetical protein
MPSWIIFLTARLKKDFYLLGTPSTRKKSGRADKIVQRFCKSTQTAQRPLRRVFSRVCYSRLP